MATKQIRTGRSPVVERLFLTHPRSLGMSWARHGIGAVEIGARLIVAGVACVIHAAVPGWFTQTAGKTVTHMYDHMTRRRSAAGNPEDWPDYEI